MKKKYIGIRSTKESGSCFCFCMLPQCAKSPVLTVNDYFSVDISKTENG